MPRDASNRAADVSAHVSAAKTTTFSPAASVRALAAADPGLAGLLFSQRFRGIRLQFAIRYALVVLIGATLAVAPPADRTAACYVVLAAYATWCVAASIWNDKGGRAPIRWQWVALIVDAGALAAITLLAEAAPSDARTADVLVYGFFAIPVLAAAQVRPVPCAIVCSATVIAFFISSAAIHRDGTSYQWSSIVLRTAILICVSFGCVSLSFIQRWRLLTIGTLALERSALLQDVLDLEVRERTSLADHLHDGALQLVLAARQEVDAIATEPEVGLPDGERAQSVERVAEALRQASELLRSTVAELHPTVLATAGLPAALRMLGSGITSSRGLALHVDTTGWPVEDRFSAGAQSEGLLYGAARELLTNVVKHAKATNAWLALDLEHDAGADKATAALLVRDDGIGLDSNDPARQVAEGHVGLASLTTRLAAVGGSLTITTADSGTSAIVRLPLASSSRP